MCQVLLTISNASKTLPSKIEHQNEIARKTKNILISQAIFLTLQFSFIFPILSHSIQNITHFRHFLPLPIQFHHFPPFSTFLRFPCQLTAFPWNCSSFPVFLYWVSWDPQYLCYITLTEVCMLSIISDLFIDLHCYCHSLSLLYTSSFSYYTGFSLFVAHFFIIVFPSAGSVLF